MAGFNPPAAPASTQELAEFASWVSFPTFSFTANATTNVLAASGHNIGGGNQVKVRGASLPTPLNENSVYYARDVVPGTSLALASTPSGAAIDIGAGSGSIFRVG